MGWHCLYLGWLHIRSGTPTQRYAKHQRRHSNHLYCWYRYFYYYCHLLVKNDPSPTKITDMKTSNFGVPLRWGCQSSSWEQNCIRNLWRKTIEGKRTEWRTLRNARNYWKGLIPGLKEENEIHIYKIIPTCSSIFIIASSRIKFPHYVFMQLKNGNNDNFVSYQSNWSRFYICNSKKLTLPSSRDKLKC